VSTKTRCVGGNYLSVSNIAHPRSPRRFCCIICSDKVHLSVCSIMLTQSYRHCAVRGHIQQTALMATNVPIYFRQTTSYGLRLACFDHSLYMKYLG
jgi:hypothetical protein